MIRIFHGFESATNKRLFDQMFSQRKAIFHDRMKWDVEVVEGRYEMDEFDRDETVYLMSLDREGKLVGSVRLLGTIGPHSLLGPLRSLRDAPFSAPTLWEATRFVVVNDKSLQPNLVSTAACELLLGICRYCRKQRITRIAAVYDAAAARLYRRCGLDPIELGRLAGGVSRATRVGLWEMSDKVEPAILAATRLETNWRETDRRAA